MNAFRPTFVEIDLAALHHNFEQARKAAGQNKKIMTVVKADAYGHGAVPLAMALGKFGADILAVALTEEGMELRRAGITLPILLFGGLFPGQEEAIVRHRLTPILFDLETAHNLNRAAQKAGQPQPFHLKIDTGMSRVGFSWQDLDKVLNAFKDLPFLQMEGVISHMALADEFEEPFNQVQIERFGKACHKIREAGFEPRLRHISNSATLYSWDVPECNLVRPGITLYGSQPSAGFYKKLDLKPVMSLRSQVAMIKEVPPGTGVSYGHRFVTDKPTVLATIPIGYADGLNRRLSNCGEVIIHGQRAPIAGTICMDWTMIDVTHIPNVKVGDAVTLMGPSGDECISAEEWAEKVGTISYEIFCQISKRVPRHYINQP
ncbi:MAG: alanine racemase [Deltaproteobacteria bacterium]|nr:alanine racemase [Deltaproteobacteria bacterium]